MNLNKKIITLALASAISASALAVDGVYQATVEGLAEPTLTNTGPLNFGKIGLVVGSSCDMDTLGAVTGDCSLDDAAIAIGEVTLSAVTASTDLGITVTGSIGTNVTFVPIYDVNGAGLGDVDGVADGITTAVSVDGLATAITLDIYGAISVNTELTSATSYTADYTVNVVFQ